MLPADSRGRGRRVRDDRRRDQDPPPVVQEHPSDDADGTQQDRGGELAVGEQRARSSPGVRISGDDRPGMLNDVTHAISTYMNTNIRSVNIDSEDGIVSRDVHPERPEHGASEPDPREAAEGQRSEECRAVRGVIHGRADRARGRSLCADGGRILGIDYGTQARRGRPERSARHHRRRGRDAGKRRALLDRLTGDRPRPGGGAWSSSACRTPRTEARGRRQEVEAFIEQLRRHRALCRSTRGTRASRPWTRSERSSRRA